MNTPKEDELVLKVCEYIKETLLPKVLKYTPLENDHSRFYISENDIYVYHNGKHTSTIPFLNWYLGQNDPILIIFQEGEPNWEIDGQRRAEFCLVRKGDKLTNFRQVI